jgi:hypothetical protein
LQIVIGEHSVVVARRVPVEHGRFTCFWLEIRAP